MQYTALVPVQYDITSVHCRIGVRYWEDTAVNGTQDSDGTLMPGRVDDALVFDINPDTGRIANWPIGTTASVNYKVADDGYYSLLDADGDTIVSVNGYVPPFLDTTNDGYGDYVIIDIDENGEIAGWNNAQVIDYFTKVQAERESTASLAHNHSKALKSH